MRGNPFYVDPGGNLLPGLQALQRGMLIGDKKQAIEDAEAKKKKAAAAAIAAYKTNDPDIIAETILKNPEIGETLGELYDKRRDYAKEDYASSLESLLTEIETTGTLKEEETPPPGADGIIEEDLPPDVVPPPTAPGGLQGIAGGTPPPVAASAPGGKPTTKTDIVKSVFRKNPEAGKKMIEYEFAKNDPDRYKAWKEVYRGDSKGTKSSIKKMIDERQALLDQGLKPDDPKVKAYDRKLWPENEGAPSNLKKMIDERATFLENGADPNSDIIKGYNNRILGEAADKVYSPSPLKKLIQERQQYIKDGMKLDDPIIKAYDNKIAGIDIDIEELSQEEIDMWGAWINATGKMPSVGRGKQATKIRAAILKSAARQAIGGTGIGDPKKTPLKAAMEVVGKQADTKAIGVALGQLEKQTAMMSSFVTNMDKQVVRFNEIARELDQGGIRILNVPRRLWRSKIMGHPLQAKYDMYLTEIESEIGKLATGSAASVAELSTGAQERWDKIHDKNLSAEDIISLINETSHAAKMRMRSVEDTLEATRKRMRDRRYKKTQVTEPGGKLPVVGSKEEYDKLDSGDFYINKKTGKKTRKP